MSGVRTILDLKRGEQATIASVDALDVDPVTTRRLHEMGFDDGVDIELLHIGPAGGPLAVRVGNMVIALRRTLAAMIAVEPANTVPQFAYLEAAE
jgi:ferrous iron transport protein A